MTATRKQRQQRAGLILLLALGAVLAALGVLTLIPGAEAAVTNALLPPPTGREEGCLACHAGIRESVSASHPVEAFGCVSCHNGNARERNDEDRAHRDLVANPGDLAHAERFCGECHASQVVFVERTIMSTYAGAITHVRQSFGVQTTDAAEFGVAAVGHLQAFAPAAGDPQPVHDFADNCLDCHLHGEGIDAPYYYRSTGCSSCHVLYSDDGLYQGNDPTIPADEPGHMATHSFTTAIPYYQCNHCHNRGNFDLRDMAWHDRGDLPPRAGYTAEQQRLADYYQPIGQFTLCEWKLDCIDCHTSQEVMGDGRIHDNRESAQYVQCQTCHGTLDAPPRSATIASENDIALTRAGLNPNLSLALGDTIVMTDRSEPFYHVVQHGDGWLLTGKATGTAYDMPLVTGSACEQDPAQQESQYCHACHAYDRDAALDLSRED